MNSNEVRFTIKLTRREEADKMRRVKNIIIGFGKAGKTLAADFGNRGEETLLVEKDPKMYGGTCINVACIPSKKLAELAKLKPENVINSDYYADAIKIKKELIQQLNQSNYEKIHSTDNVEVIDGEAYFVGEHEVRVAYNSGGEETFHAERIFINTGSIPNIPPIKNLRIDGNRIHTSKTLMDDENFPEKLAIIGGGVVGLEFASIYRQFGSEVTVISNKEEEKFLNQYDREIAEMVLESLKNMGITFQFNANTEKIDVSNSEVVKVHFKQNGEMGVVDTDKVLIATGRRPNVEQLNLEDAGVIIAENGSIQINKRLQTNRPHIFALGDVNGGPQQTYLSLDDYRIVKSLLFGDGSYDLSNRDFVPATTFINPPLSTVGLSEKAARDGGFNVKVASIPVSSIPKAKILGNDTGIYKTIINADTGHILGAVLFAEESHEVINIITTAILGKMNYKQLKNQIFTHPTMAEALNDLLRNVD